MSLKYYVLSLLNCYGDSELLDICIRTKALTIRLRQRMTFEEQINRLIRLVELIQRKNAEPSEVAAKLKISVRQLHRLIALMKKFGFPVEFSHGRRSFVFYENGTSYIFKFIPDKFEEKSLSKNGKPESNYAE